MHKTYECVYACAYINTNFAYQTNTQKLHQYNVFVQLKVRDSKIRKINKTNGSSKYYYYCCDMWTRVNNFLTQKQHMMKPILKKDKITNIKGK